MRYDPDRHHRRSLRLKGYDYSGTGTYFVTVVARDRECLFGEVAGGHMCLNAAGLVIQSACAALPAYYQHVALDISVVMPNHVHFILALLPTALGDPRDRGAASLGDVVGRFKSITTKRYIDAVRSAAWPPFRGRLWQRNYFERVVRDEGTLARLREYIANNPMHWENDAENPVTVAPRRTYQRRVLL
jgi:putative transposase